MTSPATILTPRHLTPVSSSISQTRKRAVERDEKESLAVSDITHLSNMIRELGVKADVLDTKVDRIVAQQAQASGKEGEIDKRRNEFWATDWPEIKKRIDVLEHSNQKLIGIVIGAGLAGGGVGAAIAKALAGH